MSNGIGQIQSLRAIDAWIEVINANIGGGVRTAFKANRLHFGGATVQVQSASHTAHLPLQFPEATLTTSHTVIDLSQGAIVASTEDTHLAIQGPGYFMVTDGQAVYLTRDGEFHRDASGMLINQQGLALIDRTWAFNLDPSRYAVNLPPLTAAAIDAGTAGWQRANNAASSWFPYVPGTIYDEGGTGYRRQTIYAKQTFYFNAVTGSEQLMVRTDNAGWLMINGQLVNVASVISGPYPTDHHTDTMIDIGPYLKPGFNTIALKVTENTSGNYFRMSGTIDGQTITAGNRWATMVVGDYDTSAPSQEAIDFLFNTHVDDVMLTPGPMSGAHLQYTRYGSTVWEWASPPDRIAIELPGVGGTGTVVPKALEASNASMTQAVPELSLAQKLFSALTKVLQIHQTNADGLLNLLR